MTTVTTPFATLRELFQAASDAKPLASSGIDELQLTCGDVKVTVKKRVPAAKKR